MLLINFSHKKPQTAQKEIIFMPVVHFFGSLLSWERWRLGGE
jgi:hypothetical protein